MPFREKIRKAFNRTSSTSSPSASASASASTTSPLTPTTSSRSSKKSSAFRKQKTPDHPDHPHPVPKYRGPVNPAHQAKLSAFSFSDAWAGRRKSGQSQYSPMGSRMPSRVGSISSLFSNGGGGGGGAGRKSRRQSQVANVGVKANANGGVEEMEGDDDVGNVGLSRQHTASTTHHANETAPAPGRPLSTAGSNGVDTIGTVTNGNSSANGVGVRVGGGVEDGVGGGLGMPFSEDELARAMTRSTLRA